MYIYVIVMQINGIVMQIPAPLTLISTCFLGRTMRITPPLSPTYFHGKSPKILYQMENLFAMYH